jgi:hypothetical protein
MILMDQGGSGLQGVFYIEYAGQGIAFYLDQIQGLGQGRFVAGYHQGHRIPAMADFMVNQHRLILADYTLPVGAFYIRVGQDRLDSRHLPGGPGSNCLQAGMGDARPLHARPEKILSIVICRVFFPASYLVPGVHPGKAYFHIDGLIALF